MRQCPDCEEKDRVIIAGKVFCASCGAPWQTADKAEEEKYLQKVGLGTTPASDPAKPAAGATMSTEAADPVAAALKAAGGSAPVVPTPPAPIPPTAAASTQAPTPPPPPPPPTPAPPATPTVPAAAAPAPAPAPAPLASITDTPAPAAPAATPPAATPPAATPMTVPIGVPASTAQTTPPPAAASPVSAPATEPPAVAPPTAQLASTTENLSSQIASEIPSLDSKEDPVLSDSQFSELAKTTVQPASTTPANTRSMNDVVAPAVSVAPEVTPAVPAAPTPTTPAPSPTSTPVASAATPNMTTVAGVTMSREDALKLALGDEVGADVATPADKEPKKGPAKPTAVVMSVIALVLLGAYLWQVNYPNFALRLAAMRAGVTSGMPGYVPTGWSEAKDVKTSQGTLSYSITKGDEKLTITEAKTSWDSQAVLEQHVLKNSTDYLALQAQGLTIYMYEKNQAAWVNHGSFYTMTGENQINQDDMIRIATSL